MQENYFDLSMHRLYFSFKTIVKGHFENDTYLGER